MFVLPNKSHNLLTPNAVYSIAQFFQTYFPIVEMIDAYIGTGIILFTALAWLFRQNLGLRYTRVRDSTWFVLGCLVILIGLPYLIYYFTDVLPTWLVWLLWAVCFWLCGSIVVAAIYIANTVYNLRNFKILHKPYTFLKASDLERLRLPRWKQALLRVCDLLFE